MGGICGYVGDRAPLGAMAAVLGRGPVDVVTGARGGLASTTPLLRASAGGIVAVAGSVLPRSADPAVELERRLRTRDYDDLDGAFVVARLADDTLELLSDPFGVRTLFYVIRGESLWFASDLKQLLAIPDLPVAIDPAAVHRYLTFSFVPGEEMPVRGIRRLMPGYRLVHRDGAVTVDRWFELREQVDPALADPSPAGQAEAVRQVRRAAKQAVARRLGDAAEVGVFLSGGIDSSAVAFWLHHRGQAAHALSLDFGPASVEKEQATQVATTLGLRHTWVPADGARVSALLEDLAWHLDLPYGDAVTGPQMLLARAAAELGLGVVWNGEGGDQLFGGWTSKPMVAAAVYADLDDDTPEEQYLQSYHRFYGLEAELYTPDFAASIGSPGQRRALLSPTLGDPRTAFFLNRVRLADLSLKGSQNILPRAARIASGSGLAMHAPLFDRALAELSFRLPPSLKLHGATEKHVLKLALQDRLPDDIVWRRKFGMSVPVTDWLTVPGPLATHVRDLLSPDAVRRRGWFRPEAVARLVAGEDHPSEVRRRRVGEKLWTLVMLEHWARRFVDRRGAA